MRSLGTLRRLLDIFLNEALPFKHSPNVYTVKSLLNLVAGHSGCQKEVTIDGVQVWVPARPEGHYCLSNRFRCAWLVFTGKADAVKWPGDQ